MKLIEPKVELIPQEPGINGIYKIIELAGRTCYRSYDKITEDSAKKFVDMLTKNGHGSVAEHATIYLAMPMESIIPFSANGWGRYVYNKYSKGGKVCQVNGDKRVAVTTNYRVMLQGYYDSWDEAMANNFDKNWLDDLKYLCEPTEYHEKRYTFRFITNIGISREFNRHRADSISEESTRFCGYNKGKFGNEITYIQPQQFTQQDIDNNMRGDTDLDTLKTLCKCIVFNETGAFTDVDYWLFAMLSAEYAYMGLIGMGWKPQDARCALNLNTKTELVHTAFESDWKHFCELRCSPAAHPEARYLANQVKDILKIEL